VSPYLVFVHGAGATGRVWQSQLLDFPFSTAPDLPGHPRGRLLASVDAYAAWLAEEAGRLVSGQPVLVGHSMGGAVALEAVLSFPGRFAGLVLVSTGPRLPVNPKFLDGLVRAPEATLERFVELCFGPGANPRVKAKVQESARHLGPEVLRQDLLACDAFDASGRLAEVGLPTLVVCGDRDVMTPPALSWELHRGIPRSTLTVVPGAGHMVFLERRRLFRDTLRTFLHQVTGRG
jgi:pimeloyl-ACP methyl ester carboxylesterase